MYHISKLQPATDDKIILPPFYILEEFDFNFKHVRLSDLNSSREKWLNYMQKEETLLTRCHILQCLIWVCTVCQLPL